MGPIGPDTVIGLDIDGSRLAVAKVRFPNRTYVQGAGERLPFASESFDPVISGVALPYMNIRKRLQKFTAS
jgi:ubiquinone/menaquinone biosynthesis C-methylase UbiE